MGAFKIKVIWRFYGSEYFTRLDNGIKYFFEDLGKIF